MSAPAPLRGSTEVPGFTAAETKAAAAALSPESAKLPTHRTPTLAPPAQLRIGQSHGLRVVTPVITPMSETVQRIATKAFDDLAKAVSLSSIDFTNRKIAIAAVDVYNAKNAKEADWNHWSSKALRIVMIIFTLGFIIPLYLRGKERNHKSDLDQLQKLGNEISAMTQDQAAIVIDFLKPLSRLQKSSNENQKIERPAANVWGPILRAVSQPQFIKDFYKNNPIVVKDVTEIRPELIKVEYISQETPTGLEISGIRYIEVEYPDSEVSLTCRFGLSANGELELLQVRHSDKRIELNAEASAKEVANVLNNKGYNALGIITLSGVDTGEGVPKLLAAMEKEESPLPPVISIAGALDIRRVAKHKVEIDSPNPIAVSKDTVSRATAAKIFSSSDQYVRQLAKAFPSEHPPQTSPLMHNLIILHTQSINVPLVTAAPMVLNLKSDIEKGSMHFMEATLAPHYTKVSADKVFSRTTSIGIVKNKNDLEGPPLSYVVGTYELTIPRKALEMTLGTATIADTEGSKAVSGFKFFATQEEAQAYLDQNWDAPPNAVGDKYVASPEVAAEMMHNLLVSPALHEKTKGELVPRHFKVDFHRIRVLALKSGGEVRIKHLGANIGEKHSYKDVEDIVAVLSNGDPNRSGIDSPFVENVACLLSQAQVAHPEIHFRDRLNYNIDLFTPVSEMQGFELGVNITSKNVEIETFLPRGIQNILTDETRFFVVVQKRSVPARVFQRNYKDIRPDELSGSTHTTEILEFDSVASAKEFIAKRIKAFAGDAYVEKQAGEAEVKAKADGAIEY